jgi:Caspase domain
MHTRWFVRIGALLILSVARTCWAACSDTDQDRLVWTRERMHPNADHGQIELIYRWLLNATRSCSSNGDLWYYRGLLAKQMHDQRDADFSFRKAADNHSQEQQRHFDPFVLVNRAAASPPGVVREKYALVIGVSTLANSDQFLEYGSKDASELRNFLVKSGNFKEGNVTMLLDEKATAENIRNAFGDIHEKAKADDLVLVYISSHGRPHDDDPTGISYVLTYDTDTKTPGKVFSTALKMVELAEFGRFILAHDYVLLLDTCYSGAARAGGTNVPIPSAQSTFDPLQGLAGSGNRVVISASRADEESYEDPKSKHGYFTRYLLDALNKPTPLPVSSLFAYLSSQIAAEMSQGDRKQHPEMQAYGDGQQIVLNAPVSADLKLLQLARNGESRGLQVR